jgi:hypothetical protein
MTTEPRFHRESAAGRWSVSVPIPTAEQRQETCDSGWKGTPFRAVVLRVIPWRADLGNPAKFVLAGPNIRGDGTTGARDLRREIRMSTLQTFYPLTLAAAKVALTELAEIVQADAETARAEIHAVASL